jgi:hypothetical protein
MNKATIQDTKYAHTLNQCSKAKSSKRVIKILMNRSKLRFSNARNIILFKVDPRIAIKSLHSFENKGLNTHENLFELTKSII